MSDLLDMHTDKPVTHQGLKRHCNLYSKAFLPVPSEGETAIQSDEDGLFF